MKPIHCLFFIFFLASYQSFGQGMQPNTVLPERFNGQIELIEGIRYLSTNPEFDHEKAFANAQVMDSVVFRFDKKGHLLEKKSFIKKQNNWIPKSATTIVYDEDFKTIELLEITYEQIDLPDTTKAVMKTWNKLGQPTQYETTDSDFDKFKYVAEYNNQGFITRLESIQTMLGIDGEIEEKAILIFEYNPRGHLSSMSMTMDFGNGSVHETKMPIKQLEFDRFGNPTLSESNNREMKTFDKRTYKYYK